MGHGGLGKDCPGRWHSSGVPVGLSTQVRLWVIQVFMGSDQGFCCTGVAGRGGEGRH